MSDGESPDFGDILDGKAPEKTSAPAAGDPAVWTLLGEAGKDPKGQLAVASTIVNRMKARGLTSPAAVVTDPGEGYEAWNNAQAREAAIKANPPGSPGYAAAQQLLADLQAGKVKPLPYDTFYSPKGQAALGRKPPGFENGTGVDIGGNRFFAGAYQPPASSSPDFGHLLDGGTAPVQAPVSTAEAAPANAPSNVWTLHWDAPSHSYRDPQGGSWSYPDSDGYVVGPGGRREQILTNVKAGPGQIPVGVDAGTQPSADPNSDEANRRAAAVGVGQGVDNVGATFKNIDQWVEQNVPGARSFNRFLDGPGPTVDQQVQQLHADRLLNDARYGSNGFYGGGQLAGETAATVPFLFSGDGAAGLVGDAATKFAPGAAKIVDFLGGEGGGNLITRGLSLGARGAVQGGAAAALSSGGSDRPLGDQIATGAAAGAVLNPALAGALGGTKFAGSLLGRTFQPFSEAGRGQIADSVINRFSMGGPTDLNTAELVPGSVPTLAQATANPGIATMERAVRDVRPNPFIAREGANAAARTNMFGAVAGTPETVEELEAARDAKALPILHDALSSAAPADASPVVSTIDQILASPAGQRDAVTRALGNIRGKLFAADGKAPQTDAAQLYGVRQSINDALSPLAAKSGSDAQLATRELMQVRSALDDTIEGAAPGYKEYLTTYSRMSAPATAQTYLQGLNLTDAHGNITLAKVKGALDAIAKKQALPGVNGAKDVTPEQLGALQSLYADLSRSSNSSLGKSIGSNTFQNLATSNLMATGGVPLAAAGAAVGHHPLLAPVILGGRLLYGAQNDAILDSVVQRLLNPDEGANAFRVPPPTGLRRPVVQSVVRGVNDNLTPTGVLYGRNKFDRPAAAASQ